MEDFREKFKASYSGDMSPACGSFRSFRNSSANYRTNFKLRGHFMQRCNVEFFASHTNECNIAVHTWLPNAEPKGVIQFAHGMSEYVKRFANIAKYFNELGYVFCGNDHAGHGESIQSKDNKGFFAEKGGWDAIIEDTMQVHRMLKLRYPNVKHVLYGHSMGSFISRACASRYPSEFDAFIWSGTTGHHANLGIAKLLTKIEIKRKGPRGRSKLLNTIVFAPFVYSVKHHRTNFDWLTHDEKTVDAYQKDPLCGFSFRCAAYLDLFTGIDEISSRKWALSVPDVPIYIFSGTEDPVGNMGKGPRWVCNLLNNNGKTHVVLQIYKNGRHEMHNEINRDEVLRGIAAFLRGIQ